MINNLLKLTYKNLIIQGWRNIAFPFPPSGNEGGYFISMWKTSTMKKSIENDSTKKILPRLWWGARHAVARTHLQHHRHNLPTCPLALTYLTYLLCLHYYCVFWICPCVSRLVWTAYMLLTTCLFIHWCLCLIPLINSHIWILTKPQPPNYK